MSETINIQSALSYARGILFGTKSSDPTKGETVDVTTGSAHVKIADEVGMDQAANAKLVETSAYEYEDVAAGVSAQVMGATGAAGDLLQRLICVVSTALTSNVAITDGTGSAFTILQTSTAIGTYILEVGARSTTGGWKVTTGAGVTVRAVGRFT